jgi:hypothetical protein
MGGWPKDSEAKKMLRILEKEFGWIYDPEHPGKSAHATGTLFCGAGCQSPVWSTGNNTARALWKFARKCPHDKAPDRQHW